MLKNVMGVKKKLMIMATARICSEENTQKELLVPRTTIR